MPCQYPPAWALRACERPIATACFRLDTFGPFFEPEWSVPFENSPMVRDILARAFGPRGVERFRLVLAAPSTPPLVLTTLAATRLGSGTLRRAVHTARLRRVVLQGPTGVRRADLDLGARVLALALRVRVLFGHG